ncbi:hypothetical protein KZO25_04885 [Halomonas sp. ANAO-440]|uniref:hypothetical protein n=1 Tax=Halomonas sp. ANAO-440 TaxID=2861360 RepID=UPI001CAA7710|nr:hypothetical protein [Halomonas sp. ANAO-440]MBZ0329653.1 hypothetical protein [Halomonas sp. ANAO-440]
MMEIILLAMIVIGVVVVAFKLLARDPDLETLSADQMARHVKLLQNWIERYNTLENPPEDMKRKYAYKKQRLENALEIWGRKIKEAHTQESSVSTDKEGQHKSSEEKEADDVEAKLEQELDELEAGIKQADPISIALIGTTLEMLQKGFSDRHGSIEEFSKKGGDLGEYINLLMRMAQDYRAQDSAHGEWASRLCAVQASAAYIEKRKLQDRAKILIDDVVEKASKLEKPGRA